MPTLPKFAVQFPPVQVAVQQGAATVDMSASIESIQTAIEKAVGPARVLSPEKAQPFVQLPGARVPLKPMLGNPDLLHAEVSLNACDISQGVEIGFTRALEVELRDGRREMLWFQGVTEP
jgi:hypothetical protein